MKLQSGGWLEFEYNPDTTKIYRTGQMLCKPFSIDQGIEAAIGLIYDHSPELKNIRPKQITLSLGLGCNRVCSYCSQSHNAEIESVNPSVLLAKFRVNKNLTAFTKRFIFWGGEPILHWNSLVQIVDTLKSENLVPADCKFAVRTNGLLLDEERARWLDHYDFFVGLSHNGPWQEGDDPLEERTDSYKGLSIIRPENFMINSVPVKAGFSRSDLINYFFAVLPNNENPAIQSFQGFTLTEDNQDQCVYLEDPLVAMVVMFDQYKNGLAEKFRDFWPIVQSLKYRMAMQNYPILESYNRFSYDCLNLDCLRIDLNGDIYSDHMFDPKKERIMGNIDNLQDLPSMDKSLFFAGNDELRNNCRGCPVLPLCLGGDLWTPKGMEFKECLQRFVFWAPLWTYIMNGYILETPIIGIQDSSFVHKDLYLDFLQSGVYQSAVKGK